MDDQNKDPKQDEEQQMNVELSEEIAQGIYSNLAIITHSSSEFVFDFVRIVPGVNKAKVKSRIIMSPEHAKRLMKALQENINKFESMNGQINEDKGTGGGKMPFNFGGPTAQA